MTNNEELTRCAHTDRRLEPAHVVGAAAAPAKQRVAACRTPDCVEFAIGDAGYCVTCTVRVRETELKLGGSGAY